MITAFAVKNTGTFIYMGIYEESSDFKNGGNIEKFIK